MPRMCWRIRSWQGRGSASHARSGRYRSRDCRVGRRRPTVARRRREPGRYPDPTNGAGGGARSPGPRRTGVTSVYYAVEGHTDAPVAEKLTRLAGLVPRPTRVARGKSNLDPRIPELNRSGAALNWLVIRDLDHDAACASELIDRLLMGRACAPRLSLRIPVRGIESWLLAAREGFAGEFEIAPQLLPSSPDDLDHPKQHLVNLCRHSAQRGQRHNGPAFRQRASRRA